MDGPDEGASSPRFGANWRRPKNIRKRLAEEDEGDGALGGPGEVQKRAPVQEETQDQSQTQSQTEAKTKTKTAALSRVEHHYSADERAAVRPTEAKTKEPQSQEPLAASRPTAGPQLTSSSLRFSCRFDYAPDLCKDYLETGFCGFGDSCKFVHDRGDYKMGWELDRDWEEQQRKLRLGHRVDDDEYVLSAAEEKIEDSTRCGICEKDLAKPIVETKCGHRFCEKCALAHSRKSNKCKICDAVIDGRFRMVRER